MSDALADVLSLFPPSADFAANADPRVFEAIRTRRWLLARLSEVHAWLIAPIAL